MTSPRELHDGWRMRAVGGLEHLPKAHAALKKWQPARVPGTVQGQLLALGLIPDPYQGRTELDLQWLDRLEWELELVLDADAADCARARQELLFDGIDTIAAISLNGREIGRSVNMFRRIVCDVRGILKPGRNLLTVRIASPTDWCQAESAKHGNPLPDSNWSWCTGERRPLHREWIRKVGCHFGWDWGVCIPPSGIHRPVRLDCADAPRITDVLVAQTHRGPVGAPDAVEVAVTVRLAHPVEAGGTVTVSLAGQEVSIPATLRGGGGEAMTTITVAEPELWWPNGAGAQRLYDLDVAWTGGATQRRRIGLRTIELVTEADTNRDGKPAEGFKFRVNGRDLYIKGSNWIPADQFQERCTTPVLRHILGAMTATHQNMVRVWGGGWYETDAFYDLCDELGLMVWHDHMMACMLHPDDPAFIAELTAEVRDNTARLQHRSCIALWCGDNENLTAVNHWWKKADMLAHYTRLMTPVRDATLETDPTRRFWVSSPSNGWIDRDPGSHDRGDDHFWAVWHGSQPFEHYRQARPRFASEFGFQSFPEPRTVAACIPAGGRNPSSREMEHHQRSPGGNQRITNTIARELPIWNDLDGYIWMSQANQGEAIRIAVEHWRRCKPWTMGTIYWQINDLWPVASWSSLDWHGRWKALHHAAARFYAPLLLSLVVEEKDGVKSLAVWTTSDLPRRLRLKGHIDVHLVGGKRIRRLPLRTDLPADGSQEIARFTTAQLLPAGVGLHEVCCYAEISGDGETATSAMPLVPWKYIALPAPKVKASLKQTRAGIELTVASAVVVPYLHAEIAGTESHFAGDWPTLRPGAAERMLLVEHGDRGQKPITLAQARKSLRIASLWDWSMKA